MNKNHHSLRFTSWGDSSMEKGLAKTRWVGAEFGFPEPTTPTWKHARMTVNTKAWLLRDQRPCIKWGGRGSPTLKVALWPLYAEHIVLAGPPTPLVTSSKPAGKCLMVRLFKQLLPAEIPSSLPDFQYTDRLVHRCLPSRENPWAIQQRNYQLRERAWHSHF